jgi:hypothetical protein
VSQGTICQRLTLNGFLLISASWVARVIKCEPLVPNPALILIKHKKKLLSYPKHYNFLNYNFLNFAKTWILILFSLCTKGSLFINAVWSYKRYTAFWQMWNLKPMWS